MQEPLSYYYNKIGFDISKIKELICGERYLAIMLTTGEIGVCATLGKKFNITKKDLTNINLNDFTHRTILNAYYNAILNYRNTEFINGDMMNIVDFKSFNSVVMIGYFKPIVEKLSKINVKPHIFDLRDKQISISIEKQPEYLQNADAVILTATSLFNNTFADICKHSNGDIFVLGPSSLISPYLFKFNKVKYIFGSIFKPFDKEVLDIIGKDLGTRYFLKLGTKVGLGQSLESF